MIHQLIYTSRRADDLSDEALEALLRGARENNARHDLTGVLLCTHDQFMQVLEGPQAEVESLLARIIADRRHEEVRVALRRDIAVRDFSGWHMALRDTRANPLVADCELSRFFEPDFNIDALPDASPTSFLMRAFRDIALGTA